MTKRGYLATGAAAVLAIGIGLYVLGSRVGASNDDVTSASRDPKIAQASPGKPTGSTVPRTPSATDTPERPSDTSPSTATRDYMVGGVRIRDHRSGDHAPIDVPPAIHPPEGRKLPSELVNDVSQKVRAAVSECAASVPPDARGEKPRAEGEIVVAIKNHQAAITGATIQLRDVTGASVDAVKQCIEQKAIGAATPSGDEADVEGYSITLSIRLPGL
jgi:hypothetical protein